MTENGSTYDLVIVGAGPAGLCAALYAGRGMLKAITIERGPPGGGLLHTDLIEDYIRFQSIQGGERGRQFAAHAQKVGAGIVTGTVARARKSPDGLFDVVTARARGAAAP